MAILFFIYISINHIINLIKKVHVAKYMDLLCMKL